MIYMFGYGIQGNAHAKNLRDSSFDLVIINRGDKYIKDARDDGFIAFNECPYDDVKDGDILYILIPEEGHKVLVEHLIANIDKKVTAVFAHGFSLVYEGINYPNNWDIIMIAPRYPGSQVRSRYIEGNGVPAYISVFQDHTGSAELTLNNLCKGLGFDKGGTLEVSPEEETLVDLAVENIMAPSFFIFVQTLFSELIKRGVRPEVACMELYYSGETGAVRTAMSKYGLYKGLQMNASPTCQYGVSSSAKHLSESTWINDFIKSRLDRIESAEFASELSDIDHTESVKSTFFSSAVSNDIKKAEAGCNLIFGEKK